MEALTFSLKEMRRPLVTVLMFLPLVVVLLLGVAWLTNYWNPEPKYERQGYLIVLLFLALGFWVGFTWKDKTIRSFKKKWIWEQLSAREKEVAQKVLEGKSNKEICEELFIEHNTLKTHIRNIYKKAACGRRHEFKKLFS